MKWEEICENGDLREKLVCGINIHVVCAKLPLSVSHMSHLHQLGLVFSSPYPTNGFSCDVCGVIEGRECWLYRCGSCGFDAHLSCATSKAQQVVARAESTVAYDHSMLMNQINDQRNLFLQRRMSHGGGGNMNYNQILQAFMGGRGGGSMNNQVLQTFLGRHGGSGGLNNQVLQTFLGRHGGGGGGMNHNQILQALMGSGGGGGGGGGGGDLIQGLLNGSSNGGLDLSSAFGNVGDFGGLMGGFGGFGF
ncbi:hypothetical protein R6Q59_006261 [Mikania micrantha]